MDIMWIYFNHFLELKDKGQVLQGKERGLQK